MLDEADRHRFAQWLHKQITSERAIVEQLEKMPGMGVAVMQRQREIAAYAIVLRILETTESVSIGPADSASALTGDSDNA